MHSQFLLPAQVRSVIEVEYRCGAEADVVSIPSATVICALLPYSIVARLLSMMQVSHNWPQVQCLEHWQSL